MAFYDREEHVGEELSLFCCTKLTQLLLYEAVIFGTVPQKTVSDFNEKFQGAFLTGLDKHNNPKKYTYGKINA